MRHLWLVLLGVLACIFLAACDGATPSPAPKPISTPERPPTTIPTQPAPALAPVSSPKPSLTPERPSTAAVGVLTPVSGPTRQPLAANRGKVRRGPGTNYPVVGELRPGEALVIVARTGDSEWFQLGTGFWVAALSVLYPPDVPVAERTPAVPPTPSKRTRTPEPPSPVAPPPPPEATATRPPL